MVNNTPPSTNDINEIINKPELHRSESLNVLRTFSEKYPYFQVIKAIELKILKNEQNYLYNQRLKQTAAFTQDRNVLFDFITSESFLLNDSFNNTNQKETTPLTMEESSKDIDKIQISIVAQDSKIVLDNKEVGGECKDRVDEGSDPEIEDVDSGESKEVGREVSEVVSQGEKVIENYDYDTLTDNNLFVSVSVSDEAEEKGISQKIITHPDTPLEFNSDEIHSFSEWLKISRLKPIIREEHSESNVINEEEVKSAPKNINSSLIDKFIKTNPKISPLTKDSRTCLLYTSPSPRDA